MPRRGDLYRDEDLLLHSHEGVGHTHEVLSGETEAFDREGNVTVRRPGDKPLWFPPGVEHGIRCRVTGTVYFNSMPG